MEYLLEIMQLAVLPIGILCLFFRWLYGEASAKEYFSTAKLFVLLSMAVSVLNNNTLMPMFLKPDILNTVSYLLTAAAFYIWLSLSLKWFTTVKLPAYRFCSLTLLLLFSFNLLLFANRLDIMLAALAFLALLQYLLLCFSQENEEFHNISGRYGYSALFFVLLFFTALSVLYPQGMSFDKAAVMIAQMPEEVLFLVSAGLLLVFIFMIGIAPLHFWTSEVAGLSVLPVAAYFAFVPQTALWVSFVKINILLFAPIADTLQNIYLTFGLVSLAVGAFGANTSRNMRRIFSFAGLLNLGVVLILISSFKLENVAAGLSYVQIYVLAVCGIYTLMFVLKNNGEYLSNLNTLNGFAKNKPFIAVSLLFFMLSLMSVAPLPMFFSGWNTLNYLVLDGQYFIMAAIAAGIMIMLPSFVQILRTAFFSETCVSTDRGERLIYVLILLNIFLNFVLMFYPDALFNEALWLTDGLKP